MSQWATAPLPGERQHPQLLVLPSLLVEGPTKHQVFVLVKYAVSLTFLCMFLIVPNARQLHKIST